ncbi:MAG: dihydroorotate dehydrogenase-like protein [Planctomycetes bacterium]|nr:dihydroorotate dehydrogenase-like protein [Planctomycetota bacterium]
MDLSTTYMGIELKNPIVPSSGPMSREIGVVRELEDHGASAIVLHSLFEEQINHEARELAHFLEHGTESYAEALSYFPEPEIFCLGPEEYLEHLRRIKEAVGMPVIGSLNGVTSGGWTDYARKMEQAGADALELNIYHIPTDPDIDSRSVESLYVEILKEVKSKVKIPVAVKLSPFFSSLASMAKQLDDAGANALVLFNRFYQPDIDLETLEVFPNLVLSSHHEARLPLRWIAILYNKINASLAATTGIDSAPDVIKMLLAGADVTMVCSTIIRHGPRRIKELLQGTRQWMEEREYESIEQLKGSMSHSHCSDPSAFERANYMRALNTYRKDADPIPGKPKPLRPPGRAL